MTFQQWWDEHGQYVRAGGGEYEICFAFAAWNAAIELAAAEADSNSGQIYSDIVAGEIRKLKATA